MKSWCMCSDPGCRVHKGKSHCEKPARKVMLRIDMIDRNGTPMCLGCARDAFDSGLFRTQEYDR